VRPPNKPLKQTAAPRRSLHRLPLASLPDSSRFPDAAAALTPVGWTNQRCDWRYFTMRKLACWSQDRAKDFDCGIVFWRASASGPEGFTAPELEATFRPVEIGSTFGIEQRRLIAITYAAIPQGSEVRLRFESGPLLTFRCVNDVTSYA
jgi:hypothetical protein